MVFHIFTFNFAIDENAFMSFLRVKNCSCLFSSRKLDATIKTIYKALQSNDGGLGLA